MNVECFLRRLPLLDSPSSRPSTVIAWGSIASLLAAGTVIVYLTGGTSYAYPYLMLVPVFLAAAFYRAKGGLAVAAIAGFLMGPFMPLDVQHGIAQDPSNWLLRALIYLALGGFAGVMFGLVQRSAREREQALRVDSRTQLPNHIALEQDLREALRRSDAAGHAVGLILAHILESKSIAVAFGPAVEGELARVVARHLEKHTPANTHVYSSSVSELRLLVADTNEEQMQRVVENLMQAAEDTLYVRDIPLRAQVVFGYTVQTTRETTAEELIRQTRVAESEAMKRQKPSAHYNQENDHQDSEWFTLVGEVRGAIEEKEFEVHFQPMIDLANNAVRRCEGLVRWRRQGGSLLAPDAFIPQIERTTLISPLTRYVAEQACEFLRSSNIETVNINLSAYSVFDRDLRRDIPDMLRSFGLSPSAMEIEITEHALLRDLEEANRAVRDYRDQGFHVVLDDFGTGYASLEYLLQLPVTGFKIDRVFVQQIESDERAIPLLRTMIEIAHTLDLEVTAEGVETIAQHNALQEVGCDFAQGFFYGHAMPGKEFKQWLEQWTGNALAL